MAKGFSIRIHSNPTGSTRAVRGLGWRVVRAISRAFWLRCPVTSTLRQGIGISLIFTSPARPNFWSEASNSNSFNAHVTHGMGTCQVTVDPAKRARFDLRLRVPGWARRRGRSGDLYTFADEVREPVTLKLNGKPVAVACEKGFVSLNRSWSKGDKIELNLPMPVRRVRANQNVKADRGRVALQRGPLVYCAEWPDNPNGKVRNLLLTPNSDLTAEFRPAFLNGVTVVKGKAQSVSRDDQGQLLHAEQDFTAIPYFAWANRGRGQMAVWLADSDSAVRVPALPTIASRSRVSVSSHGTNPAAINDQFEPASSNDSENSFFHWWPRKGTEEWVEYTFEKPATVSKAQVYWFDDTGTGECRVAASWRVLYRDGQEWKPVETTEGFAVAKDRFNDISFKPVVTTGLRLEVTLQKGWSAGIQEWKVE